MTKLPLLLLLLTSACSAALQVQPVSLTNKEAEERLKTAEAINAAQSKDLQAIVDHLNKQQQPKAEVAQ